MPSRRARSVNFESGTNAQRKRFFRGCGEIRDYGYVLDPGRIGPHVPSHQLLENAAVRNAYLA
jgi:hypothetical protein